MSLPNRDTFVAIVLLCICGILISASLDIREPNYGQLSPAAWPRAILGALTFLTVIYLIQSLRQGPDAPNPDAPKTLLAFAIYWQNVIWCFALFLGYLMILPYLGMAISGMVFVFALLTALGGFALRQIGLHLAIAIITAGGMWSLFTFGLGVRLPRGALTGF